MKNLTIKATKDRETWNSFIITNSPWSFFQSFEWGQAQIRQGLKVKRLALMQDDIMVAAAQVIEVRAKRGHFYHIRHGPVIAGDLDERSSIWRKFIDYLCLSARQKHLWFMRVSPMLENTSENRALLNRLGLSPAPIHAMDGERCWMLSLQRGESELLANMRKTTRNLIRQAYKKEVTVEPTDQIDRFLRLYKATYQRQKFVPHQGIYEEFREFLSQNQALLLIGRKQGQDLAAALVVFYGHQAIYRHGASLPTKTGVSHLLQWEAIKIAKKRGAKIYNFWGVAHPDSPRHPWQGITLFKTGFGGMVKQFIHAHDLPLSPLYNLTWGIETVRKLWRGY